MRKLEQLQQYELILTVRSPLFVGSGQSYQRTEYIYNRRSNRVSVLHRNRFIRFLAEKDLADSYERFILGGSTNLHSFLRQECGLDEAGIRALCVYDLPAGDALDAEHSLKNIQAFMRDNAFRPYVPGSSVKGALRTVLLYQAMQEQGTGHPELAGLQQGERYSGAGISESPCVLPATAKEKRAWTP